MMTPEDLNTRLLSVLDLPLEDRLDKLIPLFERCSVRQIQEIFPRIVHSIFGINGDPVGWGLRTTTEENSVEEFNKLDHFFGVSGPWMHLTHRLLADQWKFDLDINLLPEKFVAMVQAGQISTFYADIMIIGPMWQQVTTLSLNAFDFYVMHFVLHGLQPLHAINPIAMEISNIHCKTVYLELVADYLDNFLPLDPEAPIEPVSFSGCLKGPQTLPMQPLPPPRQPIYLRIPNRYRRASPPTRNISQPPIWRSESVLHFFVDIWLRSDVDAYYHLPSTDFVRGVRTLVKQVHFFANGANQDYGALCSLRKVSVGMVRTRILAFLCSLIGRWPLDSSLMVVLELWLSYIQPWRYTMSALDHKEAGSLSYRPSISADFNNFIVDNLVMYTHIFSVLMPHFESYDYKLHRNAFMLYRVSMMFAQHDLVERLQECELLHAGNSCGFDSPQRLAHMMQSYSPGAQWENSQLFSEPMRMQIQNFLYEISMARNSVMREIDVLQNSIAERQRSERSRGFVRTFLKMLFEECSHEEAALREISLIPDLLLQSIDAFCRVFNVHRATLYMYETLPEEPCPPASDTQSNFSFFDARESLDISMLTPQQMSLNASNLQPFIDPAVVPIKSNEFRPLVRMLHCVSKKINRKYGRQLQAFYVRNDYCGRIARLLLYAPMTEQWFDKSSGTAIMREKLVPPRVCLRPLGSIPNLFFIFGTIFITGIIGNLLWDSSVLGVFVLGSMLLGVCLLVALFPE